MDTVIGSTIDESTTFARRITQMRSYLGAYTGAFREATSSTSLADPQEGTARRVNWGRIRNELRMRPAPRRRTVPLVRVVVSGLCKAEEHGNDTGRAACSAPARR
ncbi:hypothetical protein [Streptomyces lydicus]|uniref:hypothetical protein n=1 Tax=Streptomyces lydicus TaxID=47763 RepID=UPI001F50B792|nr:hypothetical protein [Streptomyces lydicus]